MYKCDGCGRKFITLSGFVSHMLECTKVKKKK